MSGLYVVGWFILGIVGVSIVQRFSKDYKPLHHLEVFAVMLGPIAFLVAILKSLGFGEDSEP